MLEVQLCLIDYQGSLTWPPKQVGEWKCLGEYYGHNIAQFKILCCIILNLNIHFEYYSFKSNATKKSPKGKLTMLRDDEKC